MSGMWGSKIKLSIFGESHGNAIGITIDGLPAGFSIDMDKIMMEMARRAPGKVRYQHQEKNQIFQRY